MKNLCQRIYVTLLNIYRNFLSLRRRKESLKLEIFKGLDLLQIKTHTEYMPAANQNEPVPNIDINSPYTPRRPSPIVSISINHPIVTGLRKLKNFLTHKQT